MPAPSLDVVVKAGSDVIAENSHYSYCPEDGVIYPTIDHDPENPVFYKNEAQSLESMLAHELHPATR